MIEYRASATEACTEVEGVSVASVAVRVTNNLPVHTEAPLETFVTKSRAALTEVHDTGNGKQLSLLVAARHPYIFHAGHAP